MNLAIVSTNIHAYSETFIHNHIRLLPATVHILFNGHLPTQFSTDKGVTARPFKKAEHKKWFAFRKFPVDETEALNQGIETYLVENKIDLIFCEYGPSGAALLPLSIKTKISLVVHFHGYDAYRDDVLNAYGKQYKLMFDNAKAVIGVSTHMCEQLQQLGCNPAKLNCLPYGIDTTIFYVKEPVTKHNTFVSCGRFVEKKAPQLTIKAFAIVLEKMPDATLIMIGDGELLEASKALANELKISHAVTFTGALNQVQIADIYSRSLMFVQHSVVTANHDSEGTPLAILESGASGLPVISTKHAGIPDIIIDGETGWLVNENDVEAMAERMLFMAQQPALCAGMGLKASVHIRNNYDLKTYTEKLWRIIQSCA